jgi:hypothetical protein
MWHVWDIGETQVEFLWGENIAGKRPLARSRRRWEDDIKIFLQGIGWDWIDSGSI